MHRARGFTLIELMVTITVLAIITSIAAPSFSSMLRENRIAATTNELRGAIQLARSEAVKRHQDVIVCRRNSAGNNCENGTNWSTGWLIRQSGGDIIKVWVSVPDLAMTGPEAGVTFRASGLSAASATQSFAVASSSCTGQQKRTLNVSATGQTTLAKVNCE